MDDDGDLEGCSLMGTGDAFHPCALYDDEWMLLMQEEWGGGKWQRMRWMAGGGDWGKDKDLGEREIMTPNLVRKEVYRFLYRQHCAFTADHQVRVWADVAPHIRV